MLSIFSCYVLPLNVPFPCCALLFLRFLLRNFAFCSRARHDYLSSFPLIYVELVTEMWWLEVLGLARVDHCQLSVRSDAAAAH
jgi:hypothetical protein